jgi:hypothetical protein
LSATAASGKDGEKGPLRPPKKTAPKGDAKDDSKKKTSKG